MRDEISLERLRKTCPTFVEHGFFINPKDKTAGKENKSYFLRPTSGGGERKELRFPEGLSSQFCPLTNKAAMITQKLSTDEIFGGPCSKRLKNGPSLPGQDAQGTPKPALDNLEEIVELFKDKPPVVCLDSNGGNQRD